MLLVGYNRPEFLHKRINELKNMDIDEIYISIDGGEQSNDPKMLKFLEVASNFFTNGTKVRIIHREINLGLTNHIVQAISEVLQNHKTIIVVEDDVALSNNFYTNMKSGLEILTSKGHLGLVGGFSPLNFSGPSLFKNRWRKTRYFPCWGWGCDLETWSKYKADLSCFELDKILTSSKSWNSLSKWQKSVWEHRFLRVQKDPLYTWDIQMQFTSFLHNFTNIVPLYRFVDNEGFNDSRAAHTRGVKPKWFKNGIKNHQVLEKKHLKGVLNRTLEIIDANFIAGDTKLIKNQKNFRKYIDLMLKK